MMVRLLFALVIGLALPSVASTQTSYKSGYIIDNTGKTMRVEIRERNWSSNPTFLEYRTGKGQQEIEVAISDLRGFGLLADDQRFERAFVNIEQSPDIISQLSSVRTPVFKTDTVWLRQLVDGKADLFYWSGKGLSRYFYRVDDGAITPLVFRKFQETRTSVRTDVRFRHVLASLLRCETTGQLPEVRTLEYTKNDLIAYVSAYNICQGGGQEILASRKGPSIRIAFRAGGEMHNLKFSSPDVSGFGSSPYSLRGKVSPTFGVEIEQPLEFTNRRWSVFGGLNYRRLIQQQTEGSRTYKMDYQALELAIGARLRVVDFSINSVFLLGSFGSSWAFDNSFFQRTGLPEYDVGFCFSPAVGAGVRVGDHIEVDARYRFVHEFLNLYDKFSLKDSGLVVTLAYRK